MAEAEVGVTFTELGDIDDNSVNNVSHVSFEPSSVTSIAG
jgi:hypothetical protein